MARMRPLLAELWPVSPAAEAGSPLKSKGRMRHCIAAAALGGLQLCAFAGTSIAADASAISSAWTVSPVVFIPLEGGAFIYQAPLSGVLALSAGPMSVVSNTIATASSDTLSGSDSLAGFTAALGFSGAFAGGDTGLGTASGFATGGAGTIWASGPHAVTTASSAALSANAAINGTIDADATADLATQVTITGASALDRDDDISVSADTQTANLGSPALNGFAAQPDPDGDLYVFAAQSPSDNYAASAAGSPAVSVSAGSATSFAGRLSAAHDGLTLQSGFAGTPALAVLGNAADGSATFDADFAGADIGLTTTADDSIGIQTVLSASGTAALTMRIDGDRFALASSGDRSIGAFLLADARHDSSAQWTLHGDDNSISTIGEQAHGLVSLALSSLGSADQTMLLAGDDFSLTTQGSGAYGIIAAAGGALDAENSFELAGVSAAIETSGADAAGLAQFAFRADTTANTAILSGQGAMIRTLGDNAPGILSATDAGMTTQGNISLTGGQAGIYTAGDFSPGVTGMFNSVETAGGRLTLAGTGALIETTGDDAAGAFLLASGTTASLTAALDGSTANVTTSGDRSPGLVLASLGASTGSVEAVLSGGNASIATTGARATGLFLGAAGPDGSSATLTVSGSGATISTQGAESPGATFAGASGRLNLTGADAAIVTAGDASHGVFAQTDAMSIFIGPQARVTATGSDADAIHLQPATGQLTVTNRGQLTGARHGVFSQGRLDLVNDGTVDGQAGAGASFDFGTITNRGTITGASAILASQTGDGAVEIVTPGAILAAGGPADIAISLAGAGDDRLVIAPLTSISGTIELGAGQDTLAALAGTNADLWLESAAENVTAQSGFVVLLDSGQRVLIADPTHYLVHDFAIARQVTDAFSPSMPDNPVVGDIDENPTPPHCGPSLETRFHAGRDRFGAVASLRSYDSSFAGVAAFIHSGRCNDNRASLFAGYFAGEGEAGPANTIVSDTVALGVQDVARREATALALTAGFAATQSSGGRRIVNNRLAAGHEFASSDFSSRFGFVQAELTQAIDLPDMSLKPFVSAQSVFGRRDAISESGAASALSLASSEFTQYVLGGGVSAQSREFVFGGVHMRISGRAGLYYASRDLPDGVAYALAGQTGTLTANAPGTGFEQEVALRTDGVSEDGKTRFWLGIGRLQGTEDGYANFLSVGLKRLF